MGSSHHESDHAAQQRLVDEIMGRARLRWPHGQVFNGKKTMLAELEAYYSDPDGVEKRFIQNAVNKIEIGRPADTCNAIAKAKPCGAQEIRRR